ncbi:hypothetical protein ACOME3_002668 [Neoechinorhynchus agilis]
MSIEREVDDDHSDRYEHLKKLKQTFAIRIPRTRRSNRPSDVAFRQQRLPAWQPIITANTAVPVLFLAGLIFIPLGIGILITSDSVHEFVVDYTDCESADWSEFPSRKCKDVLASNIFNHCECSLNFTINDQFDGNVFFYYGLSNYYQNLRRYVSSRDDAQLLGASIDDRSRLSDCKPFIGPGYNETIISYAPCGSIANSLFNDSLSLYKRDQDGQDKRIQWDKKGIAWITDRLYKFHNPARGFGGTVRPPYWRINIDQLGAGSDNGVGYENEDFMVWMRTAAMPDFRKLYARLPSSEQVNSSSNSITAGNYTLRIVYNYPVHEFKGRKTFIMSTTSWLGGKNSFLGYAYIVMGVLCTVTGTLFLILHITYGTRLTESVDASF